MDEKELKEYQITLNEKQCRVLTKALDAFIRLGMGQIEVAIDDNTFHFRDREGTEKDSGKRLYLMSELKQAIVGFTYGGGRSVRDPSVPEAYRVALDMKGAICHRLAWDEKPEGGLTVDFSPPDKSGTLPLVEIKRIETESERIIKKGF